MGTFFSCCRRRKSGEKEPLLPRDNVPGASRLSSDKIQKTAEILAALSAGKLPSQYQINQGIMALQTRIFQGEYASGNGPYGPLSANGKAVLEGCSELVNAIILFGLQKNRDDIVQRIWHNSALLQETSVQLDIDVTVEPHFKSETYASKQYPVSPTLSNGGSEEIKRDVGDALFALRDMGTLLITSSAFRLLVSDILIVSREVLADVAVDVANAASVVQGRAKDVNDAVRPRRVSQPLPSSMDRTDEKVGRGEEESASSSRGATNVGAQEGKRRRTGSWLVSEETPDRLKEVILKRIKNIVADAQGNSTYKSSLSTLFYLLRKYTERVTSLNSMAQTTAQASTRNSYASSSASVHSSFRIEPELNQILVDVKALVERLASGRSLDPLVRSLHKFLRHASSNHIKLQEFLGSANNWLDIALNTPGWVHTTEAGKQAEILYEKCRAIITSNPQLKEDGRAVVDLFDHYIDSLRSDVSTLRLISAFEALEDHIHDYGVFGAELARGQEEVLKAVTAELKHGVLGWFVMRVLHSLRAIAIPRVEYKSESMDLVVDDVVLVSPSFVPDHIFIQNLNEIRITTSYALDNVEEHASLLDSDLQANTSTRILIDGLRIAVHKISYWVHLKRILFGWLDSGLLSVDVGEQGQSSEGIKLDLTIRTNSSSRSFYTIDHVAADIPGLGFTISQSRHWILNSIAQPFLGPALRKVASKVLADQIRSVLESLDSLLYDVHERATAAGQGPPSIAAYWDALLFVQGERARRQAEYDASGRDLVETEAEIHPTLKGIVRTTHEVPQDGESSVENETVLAIGVGEQVLLGVGGPHGSGGGAQEAIGDIGGVLGEVDGAVQRAGSGVAEGKKAAQEAGLSLKADISDGGNILRARRDEELAIEGWRSDAFDW